MLKRLRRHLNPPMVVATIALFAALGGGYAGAFSGSGTLQKAGELGISAHPDAGNGETTVETVRTLTGIGAIGASCKGEGPGVAPAGTVYIWLRNNSGETLRAQSAGVGSVWSRPSNNLYDSLLMTVVPGGTDSLDIHISPTNGTKAPQAHVQVSVDGASAGLDPDCDSTLVNVLALNTQE